MDKDNDWHKELGKGLADEHNVNTTGGMTNKTSSDSIRSRTEGDLVRPKSAQFVVSTNKTMEAPRMDADDDWHKDLGKTLHEKHNVDTPEGQGNKTSSESIRKRTDSDLAMEKKNESALLITHAVNGTVEAPRMDADDEWHKDLGKTLHDKHNVDTPEGQGNKTSSESIRKRTDSDLAMEKKNESALLITHSVNGTVEAPRMDSDDEWHKDLGKTLHDKHNVDTPEGQGNKTSAESIRDRTDSDLAMEKKNESALFSRVSS
jgi:hypothetical protein